MGWIRKTRIFLITALAVTLIVMAVLFSVVRALLPHATGYTQEIEQAISEQVGLPVSIRSLDADVHWFTPRLKLLDLVIYREDGSESLISFTEANFSLAFFESLRRMSLTAGMIHLHGADLEVERYSDTHWVVQGYDIDLSSLGGDSEAITELVLNTDLALIDSNVFWRDHSGKSRNMDFENATILLDHYAGAHALEVDLSLPEYLGQSLRMVAELRGDFEDPKSLKGRLYLKGEQVLLHNWIAVSRLKPYISGSGTLDAELWATFSDRQLTHISGSFAGENIKLVNKDDPEQEWRARRLTAGIFLRPLDDGWRLDLRGLDLDLDDHDWRVPADIVVAKHSGEWVVHANYARPAALLPVLRVLPDDVVDVSELDFEKYALSGEFFNVEALVPESGIDRIELRGAFSDLSLQLPEQNIEMRGLDGSLEYRDGRAELVFATRDAHLRTGDLFREPLFLSRLDGAVTIRTSDGAIELRSDSLRAANRDIDTRTRLHVSLPANGPLFLDIQSRYANAVATSTHKYVPVAIMSDELVAWLDKAFKGGRVAEGGFLFRGEAAAFPFRQNEGVMLAAFDVRDGVLEFRESWPPARNLAAHVRFFNSSLEIDQAQGREGENVRVQAGVRIPDLDRAMLLVDADIDAPAGEVQQYIWNSPLNDTLGTPLKQFQPTGPTRTGLHLEVPLSDEYADRELKLQGELRFTGNEVYFQDLDYLLKNFRGKLAFTTGSVQGENLSATFDGQPVRIDVSSGAGPETPRTVITAEGNWNIDSLLRAVPVDVSEYAEGRAHFAVQVKIPHRKEDYDVRIDAASSLEGVAVHYSDVLHKEAGAVVPFRASVQFFRTARNIQLASPDRIDLSATIDDEGYWDVVVDSAAVKGTGRIESHLDVSSTITLDLERLNLDAFVATADVEKMPLEIHPEDLPSLRATIGELEFQQAKLQDIRLSSDHHPRGLVFNEFSINDAALRVEGKGSWMRRSWQFKNETSISMKIASNNSGDMLHRLGFSRYVNEGTFSATVDWQWPGAPYGFSWDTLSGTTHVLFQNGIIKDIEPGAGRLLGLFNVLHLPKRIGLNFRDLYKDGFVYDSISGDYTFSDGNVVTQNTQIEASAADLTMMGRIGVSDRDYDMVTMVRPHTSGATFAGGTLAGGPTVGIGLVLLQKLLGVELLQQDVYSVKGSWDQPDIRKIASGGDSRSQADTFGE